MRLQARRRGLTFSRARLLPLGSARSKLERQRQTQQQTARVGKATAAQQHERSHRQSTETQQSHRLPDLDAGEQHCECTHLRVAARGGVGVPELRGAADVLAAEEAEEKTAGGCTRVRRDSGVVVAARPRAERRRITRAAQRLRAPTKGE